jgi:DNA-binding transcriptional MocR family regulator
MWTPVLTNAETPIYVRLADAIAADIDSGALRPGTRLPPHRELAHRLTIGIGTVTKGYEEAEKRGLIIAHVGRGSFVSGDQSATVLANDAPLDLAMNIAPNEMATPMLADAMKQLSKRTAELSKHFGYAPPCGNLIDREAGMRWLARHGRLEIVRPDRLVCTIGAQQAILLALQVIAKPGDTILCENLTYAGFKAIAVQQGYQLSGVAMDSEGLLPDALEQAVRQSGARVLYTVPTLHNPTARIMGKSRREELAALARRLDLHVVEDDIYSHFAKTLDIAPLANLIPERTFYIGGLSKAFAPGLRVGYLVVPDATMIDGLNKELRASFFSPPNLSLAMATHLINSGAAEEIVGTIHGEISRRTHLAIDILGTKIDPPATPASLHLWMPMSELEAERTVARAARAGVSISAPGTAAITSDAPTGLRLSLGNIQNTAKLTFALAQVLAACGGEHDSVAHNML